MTRLALGLALSLLMVSAAALAEGGGGHGHGKGGGGRNHRGMDACGQEVVVVRVDGQKEQHASAEAFTSKFETVSINQGESPRPAVPLASILKAYSANWVEVLACDGSSVQLPQGLPVVMPEYLVVTGRGLMKSVREVRPGRFSNSVQRIRRLTFHAAASGKASSAK